MEPLALLALLVAIVCIGYIVVVIAFRILSNIIGFIEANRLAIAAILALMLLFWLGHTQFQ
jgi:hypothetical protein